MFTLVGYYESLDPAGAWANVAGIADPHVTVSGDDILVPELNQVLALAALIDQTVASRARFRSPSLLEDGFEHYLAELASGLTFGSPPQLADLHENPIALTPVEALQFQVYSNPAAAVGHYGLAWLGDGTPTPATGRIRTVRATAAASLSAGSWVNSALTFPVSLKAGRYAVVGMSARGTNLVAARLLFPGQAWRPGCPALNDEAEYDHPIFRHGQLGVWGEFAHSSPPTVDCLGVTDTSQEIFLDLVYLG